MLSDGGRLSAVRNARLDVARAGPSRARSDGDFERVTLPEGDCDLLRDLLVAERAHTVVEIGLAYGSSALAIAEALIMQDTPDAQHVIIDAFQDHFGDAGWNAVTAAGITDLCMLVAERSDLALPMLVRDGVAADAAFVDGSHVFHNVFVDLHFLDQLVRRGGLVILDDCEWPSVATAVSYFVVNLGWAPEQADRQTRLRAFRLPDPRWNPQFDQFQPFGSDTE